MLSAKTVAAVNTNMAMVRTEERMNLRMAASPWNEPDNAGRWARYSSHEAGGQAAKCESLNKSPGKGLNDLLRTERPHRLALARRRLTPSMMKTITGTSHQATT